MPVAIVWLLRVPPVNWYRTWLTPGEVVVSRYWLPESVALFDGSRTLRRRSHCDRGGVGRCRTEVVGEDGPDLPPVSNAVSGPAVRVAWWPRTG